MYISAIRTLHECCRRRVSSHSMSKILLCKITDFILKAGMFFLKNAKFDVNLFSKSKKHLKSALILIQKHLPVVQFIEIQLIKENG